MQVVWTAVVGRIWVYLTLNVVILSGIVSNMSVWAWLNL